MNPPPPTAGSRLLVIAAVATAVAAALYLWLTWCAFPVSNWNELRLAPAFALRAGVELYPALGGGPLSTWIYGPVGVCVNLPATFATTAIGALQTAGFINAATLILPLALIAFSNSVWRARGPAAAPLALGLMVLLLPVGSLTFQVADHTANALGLLATWLLARRPAPSTSTLVLAAAACVLAIWSKQTAVFLVPAHVLGLLSLRERPAAFRYLALTAALGLLSVALAAVAFGLGPLWLNLVSIPARLPWGDVADKLSRRWPHLLATLILAPVVAVYVARRLTVPDRLLRLALCVFAAQLPAGLLAFAKIGGDINVLSSWYFLLPPLVLVGLAPSAQTSAPWRAPLTAALLVLALRAPDFAQLPARPVTAHLAAATRLAHSFPGTVWFPHNPVVTYYADHRLYHVEDGIATRHLAGLPLRESEFRRHLPARLGAIAYPASQPHPFALQLLPEFSAGTTAGNWRIFTRPEPR